MTTINATNTPRLTTNGQVVVGSTGAFPVATTITAGTNITVTNGAGSITIANTASSGGIAVGSISGNWYPSNGILGGIYQANGTTSYSTGTLYYVPFFVTTSTTYTAIAVIIGTTAAGTTVMGIYNDSGGSAPTGSPIANSNSTSVSNVASTVSSYTFSSAITLSTGIYWLAVSVSATNFIFSNDISQGIFGGNGLGYNAAVTNSTYFNRTGGYSQTFSYSATLPSASSLTQVITSTNGTVGTPFIFLKAQ